MEVKYKISVQDFANIRRSIGWKEISLNQLEKALDKSMIVVGVYENDELVAMGRLVGDFALSGMLTDIIVKPNHQHLGLGKIVVTEIIRKTYESLSSGEKFQIEASPTNGNRDFYVSCGLKYKPENQDGVYLWLSKE